MIWQALATLTLIAHAAFVLWVAAGALLALRWPRTLWLQVPCAAWGVYIEWTGGVCPLTPLEIDLLERAGRTGYGGGFLDHYLWQALYPAGLDRETQWWLGAAVVAINGVIYAIVAWRFMARKRVPGPPESPPG